MRRRSPKQRMLPRRMVSTPSCSRMASRSCSRPFMRAAEFHATTRSSRTFVSEWISSLGEAVAQVVVLGTGIQVGERQNGHGALGRRGFVLRGTGGGRVMEQGSVPATGKINADASVAALALVPSLETVAQAAGLDAHHGVDTGIEGGRAVVSFHGDHVFLHSI